MKNEKIKDNLFQYEVVRLQGKYNMLDEKARELTGLTKEEYMFTIKNYGKLMKKYPEIKRLSLKYLNELKENELIKIVALRGCETCVNLVMKKLDVSINELCTNCQKLVKKYVT